MKQNYIKILANYWGIAAQCTSEAIKTREVNRTSPTFVFVFFIFLFIVVIILRFCYVLR